MAPLLYNGMNRKLQELPWLYWIWCYADPVELNCTDTISSQLFTDNEVLLHLYCQSSRSAKKLHEVADIVEVFREIYL